MHILKSKKTLISSLMDLADSWSSNMSKDPKTKVGAVVYTPTDNIYLGYNQFISNMPDYAD